MALIGAVAGLKVTAGAMLLILPTVEVEQILFREKGCVRVYKCRVFKYVLVPVQARIGSASARRCAQA
jgi:hypothetical protein